MRCLVLADAADFDWIAPLPPADVLVSCGDTDETLIRRAARAAGAQTVLAVKGNHDPAGGFGRGITDLHGRTVEVDGLRFGGLAGCLPYKPRGHWLFTEDEAAAVLERLGRVDVLVCHNSPRGIHDRDDDVHVGFQCVRDYIKRHRPRAVLHGHQHRLQVTQVGPTLVAGVFGAMPLELL